MNTIWSVHSRASLRQASLISVVCCIACGAFAAEPAAPEYVRDVVPLFTKYCTGCHNADDHEGKLSLESFADLQKGGEHGAVLVPSQAASSRMIRVLIGEADPKMPPEGNDAPTAEEIAVLRAWIDGGAKGPDGAEPPRTLVTPQLKPASGTLSITAVAMAPDGQLLAMGRYGAIELRAVGGVVRTLQPLPGKVNAVHFSADGTRIIAASGVAGLSGSATIWNAASGEVVREIVAHRDTLYDAELSPDGKVLATCSYDRKIQLWNAETGESLHVLDGHNDAVYDLAFSPDGTVLASASGDETVKLWLVSTGLRLDTLHQPQAEQYTVTFSPDGQYVLAGGADSRIRVWRFVSRQEQRINPLLYARFAHEGAIVELAFSRDGRILISAAEDRTLKLWETKTYTQFHLYEEQPDEITGLVSSPLEDVTTVARMDGSWQSYPLVQSRAEQQPTAAATTTAVVMPATELTSAQDSEPNDQPAEATAIQAPTRIGGAIHAQREGQRHDDDLYRFTAKAGQEWVIEVNAARQKSPLDSKVQVLDATGRPIQRVLLRAVRDSYFTFRGKDSTTSDDFRLYNWEEMDPNQLLYADGEVVKLWHYPRGPDSGFQVYPGRGNRFTYFDTTPSSHALQAPCYIVEAHAPDAELIPNGLPVFPVYYENDDDSRRELGTDSRLVFTAPADGEYLVRVFDSRGFSGPEYKYELLVRPSQPSFQVSLGGAKPIVNAGSGKEFTLTVQRMDGFEGQIRVDIEGLPPGFHATTPIVIEAGQTQALGTINALPDAPQPTPENMKASKVTATAIIAGQEVQKEVNNFDEIKLAEKPKLLARLLSADPNAPEPTRDHPLELVVAPGETITAKVRIERNGLDERVSFGNADSGRNLPHGVYVDNIGLNGLLIVEGQNEREFFITASHWVPETTRLFHLQATVEGNQTTWPVLLHVRRKETIAATAQ